MQQPNPYAPPTAPVQDPEIPPGDSIPHVELACRLLWVSIVLSLLDGIVDVLVQPTLEDKQASAIGGAVGLGIGYVITRWIVHYLRAGGNWMRWVATIMTLLGAALIAWAYPMLRETMPYPDSPVLIALLALPHLVSIVGIALLHTPTARAWFRAHSAAS